MTPGMAQTCGCPKDGVIAYTDEDGDWTCSKCGRQIMGLSSAPSAATSAARGNVAG